MSGAASQSQASQSDSHDFVTPLFVPNPLYSGDGGAEDYFAIPMMVPNSMYSQDEQAHCFSPQEEYYFCNAIDSDTPQSSCFYPPQQEDSCMYSTLDSNYSSLAPHNLTYAVPDSDGGYMAVNALYAGKHGSSDAGYITVNGANGFHNESIYSCTAPSYRGDAVSDAEDTHLYPRLALCRDVTALLRRAAVLEAILVNFCMFRAVSPMRCMLRRASLNANTIFSAVWT